MLVRLCLENFKSFKSEECIELLAAPSDKSHEYHVIVDEKHPKRSLLRACAIYGANGSGKSNIVKALILLKDLVIDGTRPSQKLTMHPFKLDNESIKKPTKIEICFKHEGVFYTYGFEATQDYIVGEWLTAVSNVKEFTYFERMADKNGKPKVAIHPKLARKGSKKYEFLNFIAQGTRANQLFLNATYERDVEDLKSPLHWIKHDLVIIKPESIYGGLLSESHNDTPFSEYINKFLSASDTGVSNIVTESIKYNPNNPIIDIPSNIWEDITKDLSEGQSVFVKSPEGMQYEITKDENNDEINVLLLKTQHTSTNGEMITFDIDEESDGTRRLMHLLPVLIHSQKDTKVHVIDEIDRSMHPLLTRQLIAAYLSDEKCRNSQLIFTTHETSLLDQNLLRRDEIWFVEKDHNGSSHFTSLVEYKVRPDLKIEKGYLNGRFGAIPFLGDISSLVGEGCH